MLISITSFLAVFTIVVLVHELGHFLAARRAGVKVYEFSMGFPFSPRIITIFRRRETEFTLRLLPLGGFVSFSKDGDEEAADLFGASSCNRALIMSAGSLCNIIFAFLLFVLIFAIGKHHPVPEAIAASAKTVWSVITGTIGFIITAISGHGSWDALSGPVSIAAIAGKAASAGILNLLYFTGMLSMSLGILNLLPLPALDGGQLLLLGIEAIKGKPLSLRTYQAMNTIGFALFIGMTIYITYRDIIKLTA